MKRALTLVLISAVIVVSGCVINNGNDQIVLSDGMVLTQGQCSIRGIQDSVLIFHSPGCPACSQALPILGEISQEMPEKDFRFYNLAVDNEAVNELKLIPTHVPSVIIDCKVIVGARTKEKYLTYFGG